MIFKIIYPLNFPIVNCLTRQTQQDLVKSANGMFMFFSFPRWFAPNVDGNVLPDTPENLLIQGKFAKGTIFQKK